MKLWGSRETPPACPERKERGEEEKDGPFGLPVPDEPFFLFTSCVSAVRVCVLRTRLGRGHFDARGQRGVEKKGLRASFVPICREHGKLAVAVDSRVSDGQVPSGVRQPPFFLVARGRVNAHQLRALFLFGLMSFFSITYSEVGVVCDWPGNLVYWCW